ncbi:MAG: RHS repeat-associated core domain-containing protein, partial [Phycisphaerae bacterium]|nr:RHS repeat-associated core domain-containing protein [Phycisphaerae bacterium]
FSTKPFDSWTHLGYWGYRWYSPKLGRWVNRDPISEEGGIALYMHAGNSPPTQYDPSGLQTRSQLHAQLFSLLMTWEAQGKVFSARLLRVFLNKSGAAYQREGKPMNLSSFSNVISRNARYRRFLASYVASKLGPYPSKTGVIRLGDRIPKSSEAFAVEFAGSGDIDWWHGLASRVSGSDLSWALGTGHFGHTGASVTVGGSSVVRQGCCRTVTFSGMMIQKDHYTFNKGTLRDFFYQDYKAARELETTYGYPAFWHEERWIESMSLTCCPRYISRSQFGSGGTLTGYKVVFDGWNCVESSN